MTGKRRKMIDSWGCIFVGEKRTVFFLEVKLLGVFLDDLFFDVIEKC